MTSNALGASVEREYIATAITNGHLSGIAGRGCDRQAAVDELLRQAPQFNGMCLIDLLSGDGVKPQYTDPSALSVLIGLK